MIYAANKSCSSAINPQLQLFLLIFRDLLGVSAVSHAMNLLKFFVLVAPSLADVTCSAPEVCNDELADFALAVKKEGPEEPLKLLQIKEATCQQLLLHGFYRFLKLLVMTSSGQRSPKRTPSSSSTQTQSS